MTSQQGSRYKLLLRVVPFMVLGLVCLVILQKILPPAAPCETAPPRPIQQQNVFVKPLWTRCFFSWPDQRLFLYDNSLLVGDDQRHAVTRYDAVSGKTQWSFPVGDLRMYIGGLILDTQRQRLYANVGDNTVGHFYGLDLNSGAMLWDQYTVGKVSFTPALLADYRLIGIGISDASASIIDPNTGGYIGGTSRVAPVVYSDGYAWDMHDGFLTGSDALTGELFWRTGDANQGEIYLRDVQRNDHLVLSSHWDYLAVYDFATGRFLWRTTDLKLVGRPVLLGENIYALGLDARMHILNASTGVETGFIQFEPAAPGRDDEHLSTDSISGSQWTVNEQVLAIYFADTGLLSVYQIKQP